MRRQMASVLLAIDIASYGTQQEQKAKARLMEVAIDQAEVLLRLERQDIDSGGFAEALTLCVVDVIEKRLAKDRRGSWWQDN